MPLLDNCPGDPATAGLKTHALGAVLSTDQADMLHAAQQEAAFMLLVHDADIETAADRVSNDERLHSATTLYANTQQFIERWHGIAMHALADDVEVDTRVGRGDNGLYHEALERVMEYLGLSMTANQRVNGSLDDDDDVRRVLLPNCARNARHWFGLKLSQG